MEIQADETWEKIDSRWIKAERIAGAIFWLLLLTFAVVALVCLLVFVLVGQVVVGIAVSTSLLLAVGLLGALLWLAPSWSYQATRWRQVSGGFEIKRGIWWHHHIYIPRERIQHTDVVRGPLSRKFELATLIIHTAGTHNHEIRLEGLAYTTAQQLRQELLPQVNRDN